MRFGIISDIHGNLGALSAVLERLHGVDAYICLGDIVGYGANPNECCDIIRSLSPHCVVGNHDAAVLGVLDISWFNQYARAAVVWTSARISDENRSFLSGLDHTLPLHDAILVHSSLDDPPRFDYIINPWTARPCFDEMPDSVIACFIGHTHVAEYYVRQEGVLGADQITMTSGGTIQLRYGFRYIINCGSVGQPRDRNPWASCGLFDSKERTVDIIRVPYDIAAAQKAIRAAGLPAQISERLSLGV